MIRLIRRKIKLKVYWRNIVSKGKIDKIINNNQRYCFKYLLYTYIIIKNIHLVLIVNLEYYYILKLYFLLTINSNYFIHYFP